MHYNTEPKIQKVSISSLPPQHVHSSPHYQHSPLSSAFITINELTLTHHKHPKSILNIRVHAWLSILYGFGHMYNAMCPPSQDHIEPFHCSENPLCSTHASPRSPKPGKPLTLLLSP